MRKKLAISVSIALVLAASVTTTAFGGSFSWSLGSLIAEGWIAGLGNSVAVVTLTAHGSGLAICENNGGHQAPGRNPIEFDGVAVATWLTDENGRANGSIEAFEPTDFAVSPSPKEAGCPSKKWSVVGVVASSTNWYAAHITAISVNTGKVIFDQDYTCVTTFNNDGISTNVDCIEVP